MLNKVLYNVFSETVSETKPGYREKRYLIGVCKVVAKVPYG